MHKFQTCLLLVSAVLCKSQLDAQNNILNNGGFEQGLMCYGNWIWSSTGQEYVGDYRFALSSDSHSGAYSAQIACPSTTADCFKAAIRSNYMPTPPNQNYLLTFYAKCPANQYAAIYVPGTASGDFGQWMTCNGNWVKQQATFQTASTATNFWFAFYSYWTSSLLVDDVVLTYADGSSPAPSNLYPGTRSVKISGQQVKVDGAPFLSLGFYDVPYADLAQVAATGANTINGLGNYNSGNCYNTGQPSYLDRAYQLGLNFIPDSSTTARLGLTPPLASAVQNNAHLANIAWGLADEPDQANVAWYSVPPSTFLTEATTARASTSLPVTADFQRAAWSVTSDVAPYNGSADIWMAEPYGADFSAINHAVNMFNSIQPRPIWLAQDSISANLIVPKAYWAIIAGATGIHYFNWDSFKADPLLVAGATQVFNELKGLQNAIFGGVMDSYVTAPSGVASMSRFDSKTGTSYILAANSSTSTVQGNFMVQGLTAGQVVNVVNEGRTITAAAGYFTDSFTGVARHVYAIQPANTSLTASIGTKTGTATARTWQVSVFNTGLGAANAAQIKGLTFAQTGGKACTPAVTSTLPLALGSITPSQSAAGSVAINFNGCDSTSKFTVNVSLTANNGATSGTVVSNNQRQ